MVVLLPVLLSGAEETQGTTEGRALAPYLPLPSLDVCLEPGCGRSERKPWRRGMSEGLIFVNFLSSSTINIPPQERFCKSFFPFLLPTAFMPNTLASPVLTCSSRQPTAGGALTCSAAAGKSPGIWNNTLRAEPIWKHPLLLHEMHHKAFDALNLYLGFLPEGCHPTGQLLLQFFFF